MRRGYCKWLLAVKRYLTSDSVAVRLLSAYVCFLLIFNTFVIISYFLLPQGLLQNKHPLQNWDTSPNLMISSLQIFSYNLLSVVVILAGNMFSTRKNKTDCFMPLGYLAFFATITFNAIVLGTWSFSVAAPAVPLGERLLGTFDLPHRAGLWEMSGQLLILCATAGISLFITDGKETVKKSWKTIRLSRREILVMVAGFLFMILGAVIESASILSLG